MWLDAYSPAIMQIWVELAASKGFFAQCILELCPKSNKKKFTKIGGREKNWHAINGYDDYETILKCIVEKNLLLQLVPGSTKI